MGWAKIGLAGGIFNNPARMNPSRPPGGRKGRMKGPEIFW